MVRVNLRVCTRANRTFAAVNALDRLILCKSAALVAQGPVRRINATTWLIVRLYLTERRLRCRRSGEWAMMRERISVDITLILAKSWSRNSIQRDMTALSVLHPNAILYLSKDLASEFATMSMG